MKLTAFKLRSRRSPARIALRAGGQKYQTDCVASVMQDGPLAEHETFFIPEPRAFAALGAVLDAQRPEREAILHGIQGYEDFYQLLAPLIMRWRTGVMPSVRGLRFIPVTYFTLYQRGALGMHNAASDDFLDAQRAANRLEEQEGGMPAVAILDSMPMVHPDILTEVYEVAGILARRIGYFQGLRRVRESSHLNRTPAELERALLEVELPPWQLADTRAHTSIENILTMFEQDFRTQNVPSDETQYLGSKLAALDVASQAMGRARDEIAGQEDVRISVVIRYLREWLAYADILLAADGVFAGSDAALRRLDDVYAQVKTFLEFWDGSVAVPNKRMALARELVVETGASRWKLLAGLRYVRAGYHTFPTVLRQGTEVACTIRERSADRPADFFDGVMHSYWRTTGTPEQAVEAVTAIFRLDRLAGNDRAQHIFDLIAEIIADQASTWELIPWDGGAVLDGRALADIGSRAVQRFRASALWRLTAAMHGMGMDAEGNPTIISTEMGVVPRPAGARVVTSIADILGLRQVVPLSAASMAHSGVLSARTAVYGYHIILNPGEFDQADPGLVLCARGRVREELDGRYVYQSTLTTYPTAYVAKE